MRRLLGKLEGRARLALLALGFALLLPAWVMATVPFSAPDEGSHFLRAMSIANGHLLGPRAIYHDRQLSPAQARFISHDTRLVYVPKGMGPITISCYYRVGFPPCWEATANGNFPPLPYLLPALAIKVSGSDINTAIWLSRAAEALPSLLLLVLALGLLFDGTSLSVLGLLAALTPMVLFASSIMNSSGPELTGSVAFGAAVLRLARAPAETPAWVLCSLALAGCVSILSGPIGLVFCAAFMLLGAALLGRAGLQACWHSRRTPLAWAMGALAVATVLALIWRHESGIAPGLFSINPFLASLHGGLRQLPAVLRGSLGIFGSLTIVLPLGVYWLGWIFELGLVAAALVLARRHDRVVVSAATLLALAFPVLFWAWIDRLTGFGLQGREILPVLMVIPLAAGEALRRSGRGPLLAGSGARRAIALALMLIAVFQGYCWWATARVTAGAPHTVPFWSHATSSPPLGWYPWIAMTAVGVLSWLLFAAGELIPRRVASERAVVLAA